MEDEVWVELDRDAGLQLPAELVDRYQVRLGPESKDWPAIVEPTPSVTWDLTANRHWSPRGRVRRRVS